MADGTKDNPLKLLLSAGLFLLNFHFSCESNLPFFAVPSFGDTKKASHGFIGNTTKLEKGITWKHHQRRNIVNGTNWTLVTNLSKGVFAGNSHLH